MAAELYDLRVKITVEAQCALIAHGRAHGLDKFDVARLVLHEWALKQIHGATVLENCLRAKGAIGAGDGLAGALRGGAGHTPESLTFDDE